MKVVIKITGKVFDEGNEGVIKELSEVVRDRVAAGDRVAVVVGGGRTARVYMGLGSALGVSKGWLDVFGIEASRLNALMFASLLDNLAYTPVPRSVEEFLKAWSSGKVVVMGGLQPGQSTNAVAAMVAELVEADLFVNATNVDGVYDRDPNKYSGANLLRRISPKDLERLVLQEFLPGRYELIDPIALKLISRSRIRTVFVNAFKPSMVREVLRGNKDVGTWIEYSLNL